MPVMGGFSNSGSGLDGADALGHPGIMNSIMSYGIVMNMPFIEMELAAFQDMGYTINSQDFFGKSYYYDVGGNSQINTLGFGTAQKPNQAMFGLGTHIMRDDLTLTQAADIYVAGYASGGIRIDGVGNTLTIPKGVTTAATGEYGTVLLVSYGSGNTITLGGTVLATAAGGIGVHFGINVSFPLHSYYKYSGTPSMLDALPIQQKFEVLLAEKDINGPLVDTFTISGTLAGSQAAIQIERDAHVKDINILNGAKLIGNIIVRWDMWNLAPKDLNNQVDITTYGTNLNFGVTGDRTFNLDYTGTIDGRGQTSRAFNT